MPLSRLRITPAAVLPLILALLLAACGSGNADSAGGAGGRGGRGGPGGRGGGTPEAGYVVVQPTTVPVSAELAGRTSPFQVSEVRPQVNGVIRARLFQEGSLVKAGQTLYQIDPSVYQAQAAQARANLASATATMNAARIRAGRYAPLARMQAVSQQEYTDVRAQASTAQAAVAQNRAALESANINLRYTRVPAPISGRIGRSLFTTGALVTANQTNALTTIQRLDPMYVDIQQSSAALLALRRSLANGGVVPIRAPVRLILEDGSDYGQTGTLEFAEAMVDPATGTVTLRATFPNPQGLLLPGMYVRATLVQQTIQNAFLVPQQGVSRDPQGNATVLVVGPGNRALQRKVTAERTVGDKWVVTAGLQAGDKVIVEGLVKVKAGQSIKPVPAGSPPQRGGGQGRAGGRAGGGGRGGAGGGPQG